MAINDVERVLLETLVIVRSGLRRRFSQFNLFSDPA
jgi:hypothetical protein